MTPPRDPGRRATVEVAGIVLLIGVVVWVPLPFASVVPWSQAVLQLTAFLLLAVLAAGAQALRGARAAAVPAFAVAAVAILGTLQAQRWPATIVRKLSPEHLALAEQARTLTSPGPGGPTATALSLAPEVSRGAALTWAAAAACLAAAAIAGQRRGHRRALAAALLASGLFEVFLGAAWLARHETAIWGVTVPGASDRLRGTFVNSDHLALYLELILPVAFGWAWWSWRRARDEAAPERRVLLLAPPVLVWLTLFTGLAFTGSRAGMAAVATGALVQGAVLATRRRWRVGTTGLVALSLGIGVVAVVGLQQGFGRWFATSQVDLTWNDRLDVYRQSLALWLRFPWLGTGLATFREAFPMVETPSLSGVSYDHAHNDYLELLVTTGVVGAAVLALGALALVLRLAAVAREGERGEDRAAGLAALGALAAVAVHSLFDFGLSMPANAATLAILCGAALAAPRQGSRDRRKGGPAAQSGETSATAPGATRPPASDTTSTR